MKDVYLLAIESSCDETAASVVKNGNEITTDEPETVFAAGEDAEITWTARWMWTGSFSNEIHVAAVVQTEKDTYTVSAFLTDNEEKQYSIPIEEAQDSQVVESYKSYGVASIETPVEEVTGTTYTETVEEENIKYKFEKCNRNNKPNWWSKFTCINYSKK